MIQRSLSLRILLVNFILLVLPLLLYFFVIFRTQYTGEIIAAAKELKSLAESRSALLAEIVETGDDAITVMLALLGQTQPTSQQLEVFAQAGGFREVSYFALTPDQEFIVEASSLINKVGKNFSFREYLADAINNGSSSYVALQTETYAPDLFISKAAYNGVITVVLPAQEVLKRLVSTEFAPFHSRVSLLTKDGIVFISSDPSFERQALLPISEEGLKEIDRTQQFGPYTVALNTSNFVPFDNMESTYIWNSHLGVMANVFGTHLSIFIDCDQEAISKKFYKHLWQLVAAISVVAVVTGFLNWWLTYRMATPLQQLYRVMHALDGGDLQARFVEDSMGCELNTIGLTLNRMVENLESNRESAKNERAEREVFAKELKIGRDIQMSILPADMPKFPGIELAARSLPALEVGGDFYDLYVCTRPDEQRLIATIGDGAGKGAAACLYSLVLRSILRSYASEFLGVGHVMQLTNNLFYLDAERTSMFVTAATFAYDKGSGKMSYASAGHPCMIRKKNGDIKRLDPLSIALGVQTSELAPEIEIEVAPGDLVILYTDGVTEAQNHQGELYGEERLKQFLTTYGELPVQMVLDDLYRDIENYCAGAKQWDDITIVVMRCVAC